MNKKFLLTIVITVIITITYKLTAYAQERVTISGTISDSKSDETLIGANFYIEELKTVLGAEIVRRYFGDNDPIGQTLSRY